VAALYILSSPGRIDIIDGQTRFDVAYNWIVTGRPVVRDPWLGPYFAVPGREGRHYSYYGAPASVFALPLVWMGIQSGGPDIQPSQFLFSLTSSILGAAVAPILFLLYLELGVTVRRALAWTMVFSLTTCLWPTSNSTFDNAQHALFALTAVYFGCVSARRKSNGYALLAGLIAGVLILYQEYFVIIIPALALSTLRLDWGRAAENGTAAVRRGWRVFIDLVRAAWEGPGEERETCKRYCLFVGAAGVGVLLTLAYNDYRFGSWLDDGKLHTPAHGKVPVFGNPLAGLLTLLVSPGKGVFLYSPTIILAVMGVRQLWRRRPELAGVLVASSLILIGFISCISFAGGDWCWGPRYLTPLLPLWALCLPFVVGVTVRRELAVAVIALSFLVQVLALSVENQRFFFDTRLDDFFWAEDSWTYFKRSALLHRVGEAASLSDGIPATAKLFNAIPMPDWSTYTILGPPIGMPRDMAPEWIRNYKVFFIPRPWPLWMWWVPPSLRAINIVKWVLAMIAAGLAGAGMIWQGLREERHV
jgi:hypothetical protein